MWCLSLLHCLSELEVSWTMKNMHVTSLSSSHSFSLWASLVISSCLNHECGLGFLSAAMLHNLFCKSYSQWAKFSCSFLSEKQGWLQLVAWSAKCDRSAVDRSACPRGAGGLGIRRCGWKDTQCERQEEIWCQRY